MPEQGPTAAPIDLVGLIASDPSVRGLCAQLESRRRVVATGASGAVVALTAGAVMRTTGRSVVLVLAHVDDADEALDELTGAGVRALRLPAMETLPGETNISLELFAERLSVVKSVLDLVQRGGEPAVIIAPIQALMQYVVSPARMPALVRTLRKDDTVSLTGLVEWLGNAGYRRVEAVEEPGDFAVRGGILDVFPPTGSGGAGEAFASSSSAATPVRLDFFGDQVDRIAEIDLDTMATDRAIASVDLVAVDVARVMKEERSVTFLELLPPTAVALLAETMEVVEQGRGYFERVVDGGSVIGPPAVLKVLETRFHALAELNQFSAGAASADVRVELPTAALPAFSKDVSEAVRELVAMSIASRVLVTCQNKGELQRLGELLVEFGGEGAARVERTQGYLHRGFVWGSGSEKWQSSEVATLQSDERARGTLPLGHSATLPLSVAIVPYHELLNRFTVRRRAGRIKSGRAMDTFLDFQEGDYVVHVEHGIARYVGLTLMKPREVPAKVAPGAPKQEVQPEEYLTLEFAAKAKLHVPAVQIDKVQKYIGGFAGKPPLSTLGGVKWKHQKEKVAESVRDLAGELLRVRAAREHMPGIQYPGDTKWQSEFEAEFPYEETPDQLAAIADIKKDMTSPRPMDRLLCGDVGFGKTEMAIRAAFKACEFGKQVAVLVPTTVLAEQHERTFRSRFAGYPFRVESISRFKSDREVREVLASLRKGHVDLIIGTHRLLSQDVHFADLGLVIVDEEQRFGVEHKEALLRLRLTVDVLTMSATPIPRTLHMAMLGIRDISSLTTAPLDRRAIVTEVIPWNARRIQQAVERELSRDGQVFYVHNRIGDIRTVADNVRRLVPAARIVVGHGQMEPKELEDVMLKFMRREADVLVSTTIIESGIDIPTANTMIIDDADRYGLAELHQLRGRVGRSKNRAYCYLLLPPDRTIKEVAQKRLKAVEQYSMLGAGFKIAMRDLEIRGAGNILGAEQSGHIAAVGYEMYCRLLEESVHTLKNEPQPAQPSQTSIEIGVSGLIPKSYIPSDARRLEAYRRLATAPDLESLAQVRKDLVDAYGDPPKAAERLLDLAEVRVLAHSLGVKTITIREKDVVLLASDPGPVASRLRANSATRAAEEATVRVLPPKVGELSEVYFRPPEEYMEPTTLVAVLKRRLMEPRLVAAPTASPVAAPATDGQGSAKKSLSFADAMRRDADRKKR
ncbi:MAG TPA: transcription-repair coupling factor [Phycisphaerales bacterium]|nr:transcription-repair coupling factor [Phycisphaerales bacterium]